ncbi:MAG: proline--tRNA ligase [Candidatus Micrarchaeota archaeon]
MNIDKDNNFSDWYNTILKEAELCDLRYNIKGFIVVMPWAMKSIDIIYKNYDEELEKTGHSSAFFPALVHEKSFGAEKEHVKGFIPEVFWITEVGDKKLEERYALKPTGEACIYPMYALWVNGISDLPIKIYQKGCVWRHETKATKPFIRGREFLWIETHNVFANNENAKNQIVEDAILTKKIVWERLGIPYIIFKRPQWDKFPGASDTFAVDTLMPDGKVLQVASTHLLGQHFSTAYNIKYINEKNESEYAWQTCYGPGISRIYVTMLSLHGDNSGLVLPVEIAPVQIVIIPIIKKGNEEKVIAFAKEIQKKISKNFRAHLDLRDQTPGSKFNYWEMKGVPIRIEIGERDIAEDSVVIVTRDNKKKESVKIADMENAIFDAARSLNKRLSAKSSERFIKSLDSAENCEEMIKKIGQGKIVKVAFCTDQIEGEKCANELKEKYSCDARGTMFSFFNSDKCEFESSDVPNDKKCVNCGKPANIFMYFARQY